MRTPGLSPVLTSLALGLLLAAVAGKRQRGTINLSATRRRLPRNETAVTLDILTWMLMTVFALAIAIRHVVAS